MAHLEIVSRVGRKLAPQLKRIMSSWLKSQFDQFPPAASAARKAFNVTFPENKKRDAISFCKQDLLLVKTTFLSELQALLGMTYGCICSPCHSSKLL